MLEEKFVLPFYRNKKRAYTSKNDEIVCQFCTSPIAAIGLVRAWARTYVYVRQKSQKGSPVWSRFWLVIKMSYNAADPETHQAPAFIYESRRFGRKARLSTL